MTDLETDLRAAAPTSGWFRCSLNGACSARQYASYNKFLDGKKAQEILVMQLDKPTHVVTIWVDVERNRTKTVRRRCCRCFGVKQ